MNTWKEVRDFEESLQSIEQEMKLKDWGVESEGQWKDKDVANKYHGALPDGPYSEEEIAEIAHIFNPPSYTSFDGNTVEGEPLWPQASGHICEISDVPMTSSEKGGEMWYYCKNCGKDMEKFDAYKK